VLTEIENKILKECRIIIHHQVDFEERIEAGAFSGDSLFLVVILKDIIGVYKLKEVEKENLN
jgi:hypothetical protein